METIAPCVYANCSVADQNLTDTVAQGICSAADPPVQLPSFSSLLGNQTTTASASVSATATSSSVGSASASVKASSAARMDGGARGSFAVGIMMGMVVIAFFAV